MPEHVDHVVELIFGRWRSQTLNAGVELGLLETAHTGEAPTSILEARA